MDKEEIIRHHMGLIYNKCKNIHLHDYDTEDIFQELLTHVHHKLDEYDESKVTKYIGLPVTTYINVLCNNKIRNMIKKEKGIRYHMSRSTLDDIYNHMIGYPMGKEESIAIEVAYDILHSHPHKDIILDVIRGETMVSVGNRLNVSRQYISKVYNDFINEVVNAL